MKGWMKGCRPKEIEKGRCKLYDSQFSKSIKRQVVSYSYTDTLPKGKSREIKNITGEWREGKEGEIVTELKEAHLTVRIKSHETPVRTCSREIKVY